MNSKKPARYTCNVDGNLVPKAFPLENGRGRGVPLPFLRLKPGDEFTWTVPEPVVFFGHVVGSQGNQSGVHRILRSLKINI